jgi:hypothetical protein
MVYEAYPTTMVDSLEEEAHTHEQENLTVRTPRYGRAETLTLASPGTEGTLRR